MAKRPWWKASRTRVQARNGTVLWSVLAVAMWIVVVAVDGAEWWQYLLAVAWTALAVSHLVTWRCWRTEWNEP